MRKSLCLSFAVLVFFIYSPPAHSFTNLDLMGNYTLISFTIYGGGYPTITQDDFSSFTGRGSVSNNAFLLEMSGTLKPAMGGNYIWQWYTGFYTVVAGNRIRVELTGSPTTHVDIIYSGNTITTSGQDPYEGFFYTYVWQKTASLFTQSQLNQAVSDAVAAKNTIIADQAANIENLNSQVDSQAQTISELNDQIASMYTQGQLDQVVADANEVKDLVIAEKNELIASMFTQEELNAAVSQVVADKDEIISQKELIISSMFTQEDLDHAVASGIAEYIFDSDGKIGLAEIVFGLQVLTGIR